MIIPLKLDIELNNDEISFLRKYFLENRNNSTNVLFFSIKSNGDDDQTTKKRKLLTHLGSLVQKSILIEDNMYNAKLTPIGRLVVDVIDRDKKLGEILG